MAAENKSVLRKANSCDADENFTDLFPCPIALWTRNFSRCHLNEPAKRLIHCYEADALHVSSFWLNHVHHDDIDQYLAFRAKLTKQKSPISCDYRMLGVHWTEPAWIREISVFIGDRISSPWDIRSACIDISDLKSAYAIAEEQRASPSEFLEKVIHDLQNRLHTLSMGAELAGLGLKEPLDTGQFAEVVDSINLSVQDLCDCLAPLAGDFAPQDPADILKQVLSSMRKELSRRNIKLRLVRREPLPRVRADKKQLSSAFERIMEFCAASLKTGGNIRVEAGPKEVSGQVFAELKLRTSAATSFEFVEGQESRPYMNLKVENEGVGVSLALAAEILRRYEGRVSFRKENEQQGQVTVLMKSRRS